MSQQPRIRVVVQLPYNRPDQPLPDPPSVRMCGGTCGCWLNESIPCRLNGTRRRLAFSGRLSHYLGRATTVERIVGILQLHPG